jgi:hypothetical protein
MESSWYERVAGQLQALISRFGLTQVSTQLDRAYELICRASLDVHPVELATRSSRLNHDGTPIQFALTLGHQAVPLQFLSETGDPALSHTKTGEPLEKTVRALAALLQLHGDLDSIAALIRRATSVNAREIDPDRGGACWIGASFAAGGKCGLKIYINGKNGAENEQWARLENFAAFFGALEKHQEVRRLLAGKMTPLGMAVSLSQEENPNGRIYLSGYGNSILYYEDLLRHFGGEPYVDAFRQYTEVMLEEDCAYPTQSVVFSAGFDSAPGSPTDVKIEFCGHCLFKGDSQARGRCLRWLALRKIDARPYTDMLEVITGQMSPTKVNTHIYSGLGWKNRQEYTTIYLKPHANSANIFDAA